MLAVMSGTKYLQKDDKLQFGEYEHKPLRWHVLDINRLEKSVLIIADSYCGEFNGSYCDKDKLLNAMDEFAKIAFTDEELEYVCKKEEHYACLLSWEKNYRYMTDEKFVPNKDKSAHWWYVYDSNRLGYVSDTGSHCNAAYATSCYMRPALWVKYDGLPANNNENTDKNKKKQ